MSRPAGWVILALGAAVACIGYLGFAKYPASLSVIPYRDEFLPFVVKRWGEQRDLYTSVFESKLGMFVRGHPMETMGGYGLIGLFLLLAREYRDAGWEWCLLGLWYGLFIPVLFFFGLIVAHWGFDLFHFFGGGESSVGFVDNIRTNFIGTLLRWLAGVVLGIPLMLFGMVVVLLIHAGVYVVPPLYMLFVLFALPSIVFVILRLLVRLPILTYHYLHYLSIPHPAETAYRKGVADDLPMEQLASVVADAMYIDHGDWDALPPAWKSRNQKKRVDAFKDLVNAQGPLMEAIMSNLEMKDKLHEYRRNT